MVVRVCTQASRYISRGLKLAIIVSLLMGTHQVAMAMYGNTNLYYSGTPVIIPVCWETFDTSLDVDHVAQKREWVKGAIDATWARYSRLVFTEWDACHSGDPGIHIQITDSGSSSAFGATWNPGSDNGMKLNLRSDDRGRIERVAVLYLYTDGDFYYFMNEETFEQIPLQAAVLGGTVEYLIDNMSLNIYTYESEPIDIELPTNVDLKVVDAPMALAGDTATGATKQVTVESGLKVTVPLFVNDGDTIRVDTRDGSYVTRV